MHNGNSGGCQPASTNSINRLALIFEGLYQYFRSCCFFSARAPDTRISISAKMMKLMLIFLLMQWATHAQPRRFQPIQLVKTLSFSQSESDGGNVVWAAGLPTTIIIRFAPISMTKSSFLLGLYIIPVSDFTDIESQIANWYDAAPSSVTRLEKPDHALTPMYISFMFTLDHPGRYVIGAIAMPILDNEVVDTRGSIRVAFTDIPIEVKGRPAGSLSLYTPLHDQGCDIFVRESMRAYDQLNFWKLLFRRKDNQPDALALLNCLDMTRQIMEGLRVLRDNIEMGINQFKSAIDYPAEALHMEEKDSCALCLDSLNQKPDGGVSDRVAVTSCGHRFHDECFKKLEAHSNRLIISCPYCRTRQRIRA